MRLVITTAAALLALAICASIGAAATFEIAPSGRNQAVGRLTFSASEVSVSCALTLTGTLASRAEGAVGRREPATNPRIGSFTSGSANECSGGEVRLSFPERSWQVYIERFEEARPLIYVLNAQILVTGAGGISRCMYEASISGRYTEETGVVSITGISVLRQRALSICGTGPGIVGSLTDRAEGEVPFAVGPRLKAEPGTVEYGGRRVEMSVTLRNEFRVDLTINELEWEPAGAERLWTPGALNCGVIRAGESCSITITPKAESRNTIIRLREGAERTAGRVSLHP